MPFSSLSLQVTWFRRALKNAWQSILRNKILSIATVLIIALMLFVFNLILALSFASDSIITNVGEKLDISVEIQPGVENYTIQTFIDTLNKHPDIKEVVFIGKDEALGHFGSKYPNVISFLDHHQLKNPLPDVVRIVTTDVKNNNIVINYLERAQFSQIVNQEKLIRNLEQKDRNEKILSITRTVQRISWWLIVTFSLVGLMIIYNSININIHTHEKEIHIMKLVGAKYGFIRSGFIFEGILFAIVALLISIGFSRVLIATLSKSLVGIITNESLMAGINAILYHFQDRFWLTLSWQLLAVSLAGLLSSYMAIQLYLRKEQSF
jgi:cell division transport system permease protein